MATSKPIQDQLQERADAPPPSLQEPRQFSKFGNFAQALIGSVNPEFQKNIVEPRIEEIMSFPQRQALFNENVERNRTADLQNLAGIQQRQQRIDIAQGQFDAQKAEAARLQQERDDQKLAGQVLTEVHGEFASKLQEVLAGIDPNDPHAILFKPLLDIAFAEAELAKNAMSTGDPRLGIPAMTKAIDVMQDTIDAFVTAKHQGILRQKELDAQGQRSAGQPGKVDDKQAMFQSILSTLGDIRQFQADFPDIGGPVVGRTPEMIRRGFSDDELEKLQDQKKAQVGLVNGFLLNMLSGAAISPAEFDRLKAFVPQFEDKDLTITTKIDTLERFISRHIQTLQGRLSQAGPVLAQLQSEGRNIDPSTPEGRALIQQVHSSLGFSPLDVQIPQGFTMEGELGGRAGAISKGKVEGPTTPPAPEKQGTFGRVFESTVTKPLGNVLSSFGRAKEQGTAFPKKDIN